MEIRSGFMIALGIVVLIMTAFLIWQSIQSRPVRIGERHFYQLAKNINKTCRTGETTTQMMYLPQTFKSQDDSNAKGSILNLLKKTIPGRVGDPRIQIYYENFPKGPSLGTSVMSMGWREDIPWTRDFTGFMATATLGEFGGEFLAPLAFKGMGYLGGKSIKGIKKVVNKLTPSTVTPHTIMQATKRAIKRFGRKTKLDVPFRVAGYMLSFLDEVRYAIAQSIRATGRALRRAIKWSLQKVTPSKFWADEKVVQRVMGRDEMADFFSEFIEGKRKSYDRIFGILRDEGLAKRVDEGGTWVLNKEGKAVLRQIEKLADEQDVSFKYYRFLAERGWRDKFTDKFVGWLSSKYTTFLPGTIQREIGRSMLELDDTMRIKVMKQLYRADSAAKGVDVGPGKKIKYLFQDADVNLLFGRQWKESFDNYISRRGVVKETLEKMKEVDIESVLSKQDFEGKTYGEIFDLSKREFANKLDNVEFNTKDVVGRDYWDYLDSGDLPQEIYKSWDEGIDGLSRINSEDILEAMTKENKEKVANLIREGNYKRAKEILSSQYRQNLVYDVMYTKFMDDYAKVVSSGATMMAIPEDSVGSMLLKIDNAYTELEQGVVKADEVDDAVDTLMNKFLKGGRKAYSTEMSTEVLDRNIKRYLILQSVSDDCYVVEGKIMNLGQDYSTTRKTYDDISDRLWKLLRNNFDDPDEEFQNLKDILESVEGEGMLRSQIGAKRESLGNGIWRLWMLEMTDNYDEASKFVKMAKGKTITLDPKAPATYGFLRASSYLGESMDRSINSRYSCDANEICMNIGIKTYSMKIDESCDVILNRHVPGYAGLSNPKFYLVSPCYSELKIESDSYNTGVTTQYVDWGEPIEKEGMSHNVMLESSTFKRTKNNDEGIGYPVKDVDGGEGEIVHSYNIILKDDATYGNYTTTNIHLGEVKGKGHSSHLNGQVITDTEGHSSCMHLEVLETDGDVIAQYGDCEDDYFSLCNGTFDFNMTGEKVKLPEVFKIRFHFYRKSTDVDSPKLVDLTANRWKGKKSAVVITPVLCRDNDDTREEIVDNIVGKTEYGQDQRYSIFENRDYPNYCYASSNMVSRYVGKEYAAAVVSMAGAVPGVGNLVAVMGGLVIQGVGEQFIVWPYAYEGGHLRKTGIPRREGASCPMEES